MRIYTYIYLTLFVSSTKEVIIATTRLILLLRRQPVDRYIIYVYLVLRGWYSRSDQLFCHFNPCIPNLSPCPLYRRIVPEGMALTVPPYSLPSPFYGFHRSVHFPSRHRGFREHSDMKLSHINNNQLAQWLLGGLCLIYRRLSVGFNVITMIRLTIRTAR